MRPLWLKQLAVYPIGYCWHCKTARLFSKVITTWKFTHCHLQTEFGACRHLCQVSWNCVRVVMFVWVVFPSYPGLSNWWEESLCCWQNKLLNVHIPGARQNTVGVRRRPGRPDRQVRPGNCSVCSPLTKPGSVGFPRSHFIVIQDHGVDDSGHIWLVGSGTRATGSTGFAPFRLPTNTTSY